MHGNIPPPSKEPYGSVRALSHAIPLPCQSTRPRDPASVAAGTCYLSDARDVWRSALVRSITGLHVPGHGSRRPHHGLAVLRVHDRHTTTGTRAAAGADFNFLFPDSTLVVDCFFRGAIEVCAHMQHTTSHPAHTAHDPRASDAHTRLEK